MEYVKGVENFVLCVIDTNNLNRQFINCRNDNVKFVDNATEATRLPTHEQCEAVLAAYDKLGIDNFDVYLCEINEELIVQNKCRTGGWTLFKTTNFRGKLSAIIGWHYDGGNDEMKNDHKVAKALFKKMPITLSNLSKLSYAETSYLWDAVGSYPERDKEMDELLSKLSQRLAAYKR